MLIRPLCISEWKPPHRGGPIISLLIQHYGVCHHPGPAAIQHDRTNEGSKLLATELDVVPDSNQTSECKSGYNNPRQDSETRNDVAVVVSVSPTIIRKMSSFATFGIIIQL